jgi:hypothetical protein
LLPGTKVVMRIGAAIRPIRVDALMRDVRNLSFGFEILCMGLEDRSRLRKLLSQQSRVKVQAGLELAAATPKGHFGTYRPQDLKIQESPEPTSPIEKH